MTRLQKAEKIANYLENAGYSARVWSKEFEVRIYVRTPVEYRRTSSGKPKTKGGDDLGFIEINDDGSVKNNLSKQRGEVFNLVAESGATFDAEPAIAVKRPKYTAPRQEEPLDEWESDMTDSLAALGRYETSRELG